MSTAGPPKYLEVSRVIERSIADGRFAGVRMPGLREIAAEHGVSVVTASRAILLLRDKGLIKSVHRSGHFVVDGPAIPTGPPRSARRWGLCIRSTPGPWQRATSSVTMGGFDAVASADAGQSFVPDLFRVDDATSEPEIDRQASSAVASGVEGVFLLPSRVSEPAMRQEERLLNACRSAGLPVVLIERNLRGDSRRLDRDLVATDDVEGGYACTGHLIERGRGRVAFVRGGPTSSHNDRMAGYLRAMAGPGSLEPTVLEDRVDLPSKEALRLLADRLIASKADGVVCYQDTVAFGLILEMLARRRRVPDDLAIVGYDDLPIGEAFSIGLTTFALDATRMATEAVRLMEHRLRFPGESPIKVLVPGRLVVRESSGVTGA